MFAKPAPSVIRRRYLVKFVISILAVVLVIGAVGAVSYAEIDETVRTDSDEQIESTAELQADAIGDWIENMRIQTRTVSSSPTLQEDNPPAIQGQLVEEQARMSADVRAIHYVDTAEGTVVTSTDAQHRETDLGISTSRGRRPISTRSSRSVKRSGTPSRPTSRRRSTIR